MDMCDLNEYANNIYSWYRSKKRNNKSMTLLHLFTTQITYLNRVCIAKIPLDSLGSFKSISQILL